MDEKSFLDSMRGHLERIESASDLRECEDTIAQLQALLSSSATIESIQGAIEVKKAAYRLWNIAVDSARKLQKRASDRQLASSADYAIKANLELRHTATSCLSLANTRMKDIESESLMVLTTMYWKTGLLWADSGNDAMAQLCFTNALETSDKVLIHPEATQSHRLEVLQCALGIHLWQAEAAAKNTDVEKIKLHLKEAQPILSDDAGKVLAGQTIFNIAKALYQQHATVWNLECKNWCQQSIEIEQSRSSPNSEVLAMRMRLLASLLLDMDDYPAALSCIEACESLETNKATLLLKVKLQLKFDDQEQHASEAIRAMIQMESVDFQMAVSAIKLAMQHNRRIVARAGVTALIDKSLGQPARLEEARLMQFELHAADAAAGDMTEAGLVLDAILMEHHSGACRLKPESIKQLHFFAWGIAVRLMREDSDFTAALQWFRRILSLLPSDEVAASAQCLRLAAHCAKQINDLDIAIEFILRSIKMEPEAPTALLTLFSCYLKKSAIIDAKNCLKKIASLKIDKASELLEECAAISIEAKCEEVAAVAFEMAINSPAPQTAPGHTAILFRKFCSLTPNDSSRMKRIANASDVICRRLESKGIEDAVNNNLDEVKWLCTTLWNESLKGKDMNDMSSEMADILATLLKNCFRASLYLPQIIDTLKLQSEALAASVEYRVYAMTRKPDATVATATLKDVNSCKAVLQSLARVSQTIVAEDAMDVDSPPSGAFCVESWKQQALKIERALSRSELLCMICRGEFDRVIHMVSRSNELEPVDFLRIALFVETLMKDPNLKSKEMQLWSILLECSAKVLSEISSTPEAIETSARTICLIVSRLRDHTEALKLVNKATECLLYASKQPNSLKNLQLEVKWLVTRCYNTAVEYWRRQDYPAAKSWILASVNAHQYLDDEVKKLEDFQRIPAAMGIIAEKA